MLRRGSVHAAECFAGGFIGTDFGIEQDLKNQLPDNWRDFNQRFVPIYLANRPDRTKTGAGLACGFLWTVSKGIQTGDIVLCPDGSNRYRVGEVTGDYYYAPGQILFHRRPVRWTDTYVERSAMSLPLKRSAGSIGTVCNLTRSGHQDELDRLVGQTRAPALVATDKDIEDPNTFALEAHLQEFLVHNWRQTELGQRYDIYQDEETDGEQVEADGGFIDTPSRALVGAHWRGVWHDILWMSRACPVRVWDGGRLFRVLITGTGRKRLHTLKALSHADETGRPCVTVMLPEED